MPRPAELEILESKNGGGFWTSKSGLERILIGVTCLAILIIIVLLFLVAKKETDFALKYCNTTTCLSEASKVASYIDPDINPCDDFYQFACGNFLKNAHGDETLALPQALAAQGKRELFEAYIEPIQEDEHKMVKAAKKLFRACMNETEIENDHLYTMKEVLKDIGGWPVVEGSSWNEENFDWLNTSYKLRELGYHFSVFLELTIVPNPQDSKKYMFKVATPDMWDYSTRNFDKIEFMTEVAAKFGAKDKRQISEEMVKADAFLTQLQLEIHNRYTQGTHNNYTVDEYHQKCESLNWLEFINKIASPPAAFSKDDYVLFPPPETLRSWIDLISRTPKRTQANYMIWKVIQTTLPYLTEDLRNSDNSNRKRETREEFCLREIQERFIPSPIDIICDRKYLPKERITKVKEIAQNIKSQLVEALEKVKWLNNNDKQVVLDKANAIKLVIGQPGDYFEDKILDDIDVDMIETKNNSFLSLIAQANRNRQTTQYQLISKSSTEYLSQKWVFQSGSGLPIYSEENDVIYLPAVGISGFLYDETRPNYLNYGALGVQLGQQFSGVLHRYVKHDRYKKLECMDKAMEDYKLKYGQFQFGFIMHQSIGQQISHSAYEKWVKDQGGEQHLIKMDYTPNQLFWISATSTLCQPFSSYGSIQRIFKDPKILSTMISGSIRNNPQFAKDFECPKRSKMSPANRCQLV